MKNKLLILLFTFFIFITAACNKDLASPIISINDEGIISWEEIDKAETYEIYINEITKSTEETTFDLKTVNDLQPKNILFTYVQKIKMDYLVHQIKLFMKSKKLQ